ncbi:MAG: NAD(P)/FAD-dependent oxidoreductase [Acidimicrobiales bacterium]
MALDPQQIAQLVSAARPAVFWTDREGAPDVASSLGGRDNSADLAIVGAGFTGLWAALQAVEEQPGRVIVVLEAEVAGFGASTRNGGFCEASLTHGLLNGISHWPDEIAALQRMGRENLNELIATAERLGIDAAIEATGQLHVADKPWQIGDLREMRDTAAAHGETLEWLDTDQVRAEVNSPTYLGGLWDREGGAMIDPALLTWGLRRACEDRGVVFHDNTRVKDIRIANGRLLLESHDDAWLFADRAVIATNAWGEPERQIRRYVIPIYDHVLMTEPLSAEQMGALGWRNRQGLADSANQFHYYRLTADNRILWGGYDANYHAGNGIGSEYEQRTDSHEKIAGHFFETFPQLEGLGFSHRWAGPIGTTSKFTAAFGTRHRGAAAWVAGYTGLGVGASRWAARVALDLVDGRTNERTALSMVRRKPIPFPPEPFRNLVVQFTRKQIARADVNDGRPGTWLKMLDSMGVGFDS